MITDFATGRQIDTQALLRMARYAEEAEEFCMGNYWCGSHGCLIGTYVFREGMTNSIKSRFGSFVGFRKQFAGLSSRESDFLFTGHKDHTCTIAELLTKEQAIRRLRKFIYYKLRKSELLSDYQAARRMGDVGFVGKVLEAVS